MPYITERKLRELKTKAEAYDLLNKDFEYINDHINWDSFHELKNLIKFLRLRIGLSSAFAMMRLGDLIEKLFQIDWNEKEKENNVNIYYLNGYPHRDNGPAIEWNNGDKEYFINGRLHREDGPAVERGNKKEWWYKGNQIFVNTQEDFERELLLLNFK